MFTKHLILALLIVNTAQATVTGKQFSADAVISIPGQQQTTSKLYVGNNVVRTEVTTQNGLIIDIVFPLEGKLIKLNPQLKQYIEIPTQKQSTDTQTKGNPCRRLQNATCTRLADENINGFNTQKWQIITVQQGQNIRTLHWIDSKRQLAIREFFSDGSMAEMVLKSKETVNSRKTEKWVRTLSRPDGSTVNSFQWYDPQLEISIREELPGGYIRELKNIKVTKQPVSLFKIPEGFSIMKQPARSNKPQQTYR